MAFLNTVTSAGINNRGDFFEEGTWAATGGSTTGTLTPGSGMNFPGQYGAMKLSKIEQVDLFPDTGFTVTYTQTATEAGLSLTFTANATGRYHLEGPAA